MRAWLGNDGGPATAGQHAQFARGFAQYLTEGRAPTQAVADAFGALRQWLARTYRGLDKARVPISDDVRAVFNRFIKGPARAVVIGPDRAPLRNMAVRHSEMAETTLPSPGATAFERRPITRCVVHRASTMSLAMPDRVPTLAVMRRRPNLPPPRRDRPSRTEPSHPPDRTTSSRPRHRASSMTPEATSSIGCSAPADVYAAIRSGGGAPRRRRRRDFRRATARPRRRAGRVAEGIGSPQAGAETSTADRSRRRASCCCKRRSRRATRWRSPPADRSPMSWPMPRPRRATR